MAQFYREFVVPNKPCIITGDSLPNLGQRWTDEYLLRTVGHHTVRIWCGPRQSVWWRAYLQWQRSQVTVDVTPGGRGDAVVDIPGHGPVFVKPEERRMKFAEFLPFLHDSRRKWVTDQVRRVPPPTPKCAADPTGHPGAHDVEGVSAERPAERQCEEIPYLSHQNDGLREELAPLLADCEPGGSALGRAVFGCDPDTVNFWFGFGGAVSTVHKDPYENTCVAWLQRCPPGALNSCRAAGTWLYEVKSSLRSSRPPTSRSCMSVHANRRPT